MKIRLVFIAIVFFTNICNAISQRYSIGGYIMDEDNRETLIGATLMLKGQNKGSSSDNNGFIQIGGLTIGTYTLVFRCIGYYDKEVICLIDSKSIILDDILLKPKSIEIDEITIVAPNSNTFADAAIESKIITLKKAAIINIPASRNDIFKAIKYLPGVEETDFASPLYSVRGGESGENMILLDGVSIYNPYHFISGSGIFNLYSIKKIDLSVGGYGAEFGGKNSSVLNITTRDGDKNGFHGEIEPSLTYSSAVLDIPINKNNSLIVSGRYYYGLTGRFLFYSNNYFYDFNVSFLSRLSKRTKMYFKYFKSKDKVDFKMSETLSYIYNTFEDLESLKELDYSMNNTWRNNVGTIILKTIISPKLYLHSQFYLSSFSSDNFSLYNYEVDIEHKSKNLSYFLTQEYDNAITDLGAKFKLNYFSPSRNLVTMGFETNRYVFKNHMAIDNVDLGRITKRPELKAAFIEDKLTLGPLIIRPGIRATYYSFFKDYLLEPRLNIVLNLPSDYKLKLAWGNYYQYIVTINTSEFQLSQYIDNYFPLENYKPSFSVHNIIGLEKAINSKMLLSINAYYKDIKRTYTFDNNSSMSDVNLFTNRLKEGTGKAYGIELEWKGGFKNISGWVSYNLSRSTRNFPHIMNNKTYLYDYDRLHSLKVVGSYSITDKLKYNVSYNLTSGRPITLSKTAKNYFNYSPVENRLSTTETYNTLEKSNVRLPMQMKLDFGIIKELKDGKGARLASFIGADKSYLKITFENLLFFRRNVLLYIPDYGQYFPYGFNYLPYSTVAYTIKF